MCQTVEEARAHVLALLLLGHSPEEVEAKLEVPQACVLDDTALSDPSNVLMVEVVPDGTRSS